MTNFFDLLFKTRAKKSDDELGVYPESVHVIALPERRYLWASRLLVLISVFSICFNIMLASILFMMLPNIGSYPQLFYKDRRFNRVELVEPQEIVMDSSDLVAEMLIAEYLFLRHTIRHD